MAQAPVPLRSITHAALLSSDDYGVNRQRVVKHLATERRPVYACAMTFAERLAYAMDKRGISQARLAKLVGVSRAHVSNWLLQKRELPHGVHIVFALAKVLGVPVSWLVDGEPPNPTFEGELTAVDKCDTRARAVEIVAGEIMPAAIAIVQGEEGERSAYGWIVRMQEIERAIRSEMPAKTFLKKSPKPAK